MTPPTESTGNPGAVGVEKWLCPPPKTPQSHPQGPEAPRLPGTEQLGQGGQAWPPGLSTGTSGTGGTLPTRHSWGAPKGSPAPAPPASLCVRGHSDPALRQRSALQTPQPPAARLAGSLPPARSRLRGAASVALSPSPQPTGQDEPAPRGDRGQQPPPAAPSRPRTTTSSLPRHQPSLSSAPAPSLQWLFP